MSVGATKTKEECVRDLRRVLARAVRRIAAEWVQERRAQEQSDSKSDREAV